MATFEMVTGKLLGLYTFSTSVTDPIVEKTVSKTTVSLEKVRSGLSSLMNLSFLQAENNINRIETKKSGVFLKILFMNALIETNITLYLQRNLMTISIMKKGIHPEEYRLVVFKDMSNDYSFMTKSTAPSKETIKWEDGNEYPLVKLEISHKSHPFYTGKMKLVDTAGRIDKFKNKYAKFNKK